MRNVTVSEVLSHLMFVKKIRTAELARRINLPQPTVHRIVSGTSPNPHMSSLIPLAKFFEVSIEQLKGLESIPWLRKDHAVRLFRPEWHEVPMLSIEQAPQWASIMGDEKQHYQLPSVYTDAKVSDHAFGILMPDSSMEPQFMSGSTLIIDPEQPPRDRHFILIQLHAQPLALFRQLLIDGNQRYLKPLNPDLDKFPMISITDKDQILGVLIQARMDYLPLVQG
jgi:SOS-response transcriptional repressor LexA